MVLFLSDEMDMDIKLPEVFGLLGEKMTMRFLEIFGGRTIEVPSVKMVREAYKAVSAFLGFEQRTKVGGEEDVATEIGIELDMTPKQVLVARAKVRDMLFRLEEAVKDVAGG